MASGYYIQQTNVDISAYTNVVSANSSNTVTKIIRSDDTLVYEFSGYDNGHSYKKPETRKQIKLRQSSAFKQFYGKPTYQPSQKKSRSADYAEKHKRPLKYKNINENLIL